MCLNISWKLAVRWILIVNLMRSRVNLETSLWGGRSLKAFPERFNEGKAPPPRVGSILYRCPGTERSKERPVSLLARLHFMLVNVSVLVCSRHRSATTAAATTATRSPTNIGLPLLQPANMDRRPATLDLQNQTGPAEDQTGPAGASSFMDWLFSRFSVPPARRQPLLDYSGPMLWATTINPFL